MIGKKEGGAVPPTKRGPHPILWPTKTYREGTP